MASNEDFNLLTDIITFLKSYSWLHNFPVIKIFSLNVLDRLPEDWQLWFQNKNHDISIIFPSESLPIECDSLKSFIANCHKFSVALLLLASCKDYKGLTKEYVVDSSQSNKKDLSRKSDHLVHNQFQLASISIPAQSIPNQFHISIKNGFNSESSAIKMDEEFQFISKEIWKKIKKANPKKKHEVEQLSIFIRWIKKYTKSDNVLDIGSGLVMELFKKVVNNFVSLPI